MAQLDLTLDKNFSKPFILQEFGGDERIVTMTRSSLPHRGVGWGISQRVVTQWAAGATMATQQVLGSTFGKTSSLEGSWRRNLLGHNPVKIVSKGTVYKVSKPGTLRTLFEDLARQGNLIEATWGEYTRRGRIREFSITAETEDNLTWKLSFDWIGDDHGEQKRVSTRSTSLKSDLDAMLLNGQTIAQTGPTNLAIELRGKAPSGIPNLTIGQINSFIEGPAKLVDSLARNVRELTGKIEAIASIPFTIRDMPSHIRESILSTSVDIVAKCNQFVDNTNSVPLEEMSVDQTYENLLVVSGYYDGKMTQAELYARHANRTSEKIRRLRGGVDKNDIRAIHLYKLGETLESISFKYYKSIDYVDLIISSNHLAIPTVISTSSQGTPEIGGKSVLVIPEV